MAAAASLEYSYEEELLPMFEKENPNITVKGTYDSSGKLQTQIEEGIEADVFMSAATKQMNALTEQGLVEKDSVVDLLQNQIVLITAADSTLDLQNFEDITKANVIAIGDPESVPVGQYSKEVLTNLGIWDAVSAKASLGTNVTEVLKWVEEGSADAGIVYATDAATTDKVKVVAELLPYSGGLKRNIVQCLDDFQIPLKLSHTVVDIKGKERVESVTLAKVDENRRPIPGTEEEYTCDTLLLSVGLIPENELSRGMGVEMNPVTNGPRVNESLETNLSGVFACGNVLHVHDLVDFVSEEAALAGKHAAEYIKKKQEIQKNTREIPVRGENGVRYTVPEMIRPEQMEEKLPLRFRVGQVYHQCYLSVYLNGERILHRKRPVMAPGEMETVWLEKKKLEEYPDLTQITVRIEEE